MLASKELFVMAESETDGKWQYIGVHLLAEGMEGIYGKSGNKQWIGKEGVPF